MTWPQPTREDHERFCKNEGWRRLRDARGRTGTHHITYELDLPDGGVLRAQISHPPDRTTYGPSLWAHILRDQLRVSDEEFWACVREGRRPGRGERPMPSDALPTDLVHLLIHRVGLTDTEVAGMSKDEAVDRLRRFWSGD
jgi:hypothetical protein